MPLFESRRTFREFLNAVGRIDRVDMPTIFFEVSGVTDSPYSDGIRSSSRYFLDALTQFADSEFRLVLVEGIGGNFFVSRYQWDVEKKTFFIEKRTNSRKKWNPSKSDFLVFPTFQYFSSAKKRSLLQLREKVQVVTFVYDTLPIRMPEFFTKQAVDSFQKAFYLMGAASDIVITNSNIELRHISLLLKLEDSFVRSPKLVGKVDLRSVTMLKSHTLDNDFLGQGLVPGAFLTSESLLLAISTVEPRKGYDDLIASTDLAWKAGANFKLILVGRLGWVNSFFEREFRAYLERHKDNVIWLPGVGDGELLSILKTSSLLIAPSRAEGYGLSIIDAAMNGLPILARDIDVSRELHSSYVCFFGEVQQFKNLEDSLFNLSEVMHIAKRNLENFILPDYNLSLREFLKILRIDLGYRDAD